MELFFKTPVYIVPTNVTKEFLQGLEKDIYEMKVHLNHCKFQILMDGTLRRIYLQEKSKY